MRDGRLPSETEIVETGDVGNFDRCQRAVEYAEIVHLTCFKAGIAKAKTDCQVRFAAIVSNILPQMVANYFGLGQFSIDKNMETAGVARSIIGKGNMYPFVGWDHALAAHFDRISRPLMMDAH